jgi:hypothetical protein
MHDMFNERAGKRTTRMDRTVVVVSRDEFGLNRRGSERTKEYPCQPRFAGLFIRQCAFVRLERRKAYSHFGYDTA